MVKRPETGHTSCFCCGYRPVEVNRTAAGAFSLRTDAPTPRRPALVHKTP